MGLGTMTLCPDLQRSGSSTEACASVVSTTTRVVADKTDSGAGVKKKDEVCSPEPYYG